MSDLVDRHAALNALIYAVKNVGVLDSGDIRTVFKALPTIQPIATDTNVGDTISRQAVIDAVEKNACNTQRIMDAVNNLPSAQPETAKRIVGKWRDGMTLWYQCDMCDEPVDEQDNYCRGCGRRLIDG